jgi:hypothetical protein
VTSLRFDSRRTASLDGIWEFFPGRHDLAGLDGPRAGAEPIRVPGLWEAQGWLDLDGEAWYRRRFELDDASGHWTLRFGAVMDMAEVFLNGARLGDHDQAFTPFELDPTAVLRPGENVLAVRVVDPSLHQPEHLRTAHGKQGWANHVFPSRPSLYMTYGGIWQGVTLRRHGPVVVGDVFVNADPEDLRVTARVENRGLEEAAVRLGVRTLGLVAEIRSPVAGGGSRVMEAALGRSTAPHWSPEDPVLHDATLDVHVDGRLSDSDQVRYGLRTVRIEGKRMLIDGRPYRMRSALVQGFRADALYAEGSRDEIAKEVAAARAMGFNTLRLHIKAFDPRYLDVCDEMGMLLHCDVPVAEPLAHEEMGGDTLLTRRCVAAAREQVRRDRNHPSIVLWSAMNEIGDSRPEARGWPAYEAFARALAGTVTEEDPTRPVIENDWVEPDPERVFVSPLLTAHWYGRLHRDYLDKIEAACRRWAGEDRPLFVTEFGDWGLPGMPLVDDPPFWDSREVYAAGLAGTLWPGSVARFFVETQRYQGLADRLQAEVFRRHAHVGGYCLTELTDVPQELNGLLDLFRRPKRIAVAEMTRANQAVLPMLTLDSLVVEAGGRIRAPLHVANDGPRRPDLTLHVRFGQTAPATVRRLGDVPGWSPTAFAPVDVVAPEVPGSHDLTLRLVAGDERVAENRYPIHVVARPRPPTAVRLVGGGPTTAALAAVGAPIGDEGPTIVAEDALDAATGREVRNRLEQGEVVVVMAQGSESAPHYPVPVDLQALTTVWGSTVFRFTTDHGAVPSLPRRAVLVAEDSTVQAAAVLATVDGRPFPDTPVVIAYKPVPGALTGTVLGSHSVGPGRLVCCQYRLAERAAADDGAARSLLADVLHWATDPRPVVARQASVKADGRSLVAYSWADRVAR